MPNNELLHDVVLSIQKILDIQANDNCDPLDRLSNFNPVAVLNQVFPDEASLGRIESIQTRLRENERELQVEIDALQAELQQGQDPNRMQNIQEMISDLLGQMSRIREKATESEAIVRNITKDIQVLDLAKKNLLLSMTTLKRLQMLTIAVSRLEEFMKDKMYADMAQTLAAVKQITASFKSYTSVDLISRIWRRVQELQGEIRTLVEADFDAFYLQDPAKPIKLSTIHDACQIVDVLGSDVRLQLIERYVAIELKEYRRIFRPADEAGHLDNISRRFAWFRRVLSTHEAEQGRGFPEAWKVGWFLSSKFIEITRDDISNLLSKAGSSLTVTLLLESLQQCSEFEVSIARKYSTTMADILKLTSPSPTQSVKSITSAFDSHMGVFVDAQDKAIADMLAPHRTSKPTRPSLDLPPPPSDPEDGSSSPAIVLPSSTELFYFYSQSLEQCAKLSTRKTLFDLCGVQKKWLRTYAEEVLITALKRPAISQARKSMETRYDPAEVRNACLLVNTSDYCQTTALELEEKIREKIDEEFKEKITLQPERDLFVGVISGAIVVLLRELEAACDAPFTTLSRTAWPTMNNVSGQSSYVNDLVQAIEQFMDLLRPLLEQKKYLRNFYDKAASLLITKFTNAIVKSRPLKEIGGEQLMIDLQSLKACLLRIPGESSTTSIYARGVAKSTSKLETLFKVLVTPVDPPEGFILNYTLIIGDASFSNFQKVLDLKGTPRNEQNALLDSFLTTTSTKPELETASFLSSLDMDPTPGQAVGILVSPGGSRVALPSMLAGAASVGSPADSIFAALGSPPVSGPPTGSDGTAKNDADQKQKVFPDLRRFVNFGLRRESVQPS